MLTSFPNCNVSLKPEGQKCTPWNNAVCVLAAFTALSLTEVVSPAGFLLIDSAALTSSSSHLAFLLVIQEGSAKIAISKAIQPYS